jgi:hypothetical protein
VVFLVGYSQCDPQALDPLVQGLVGLLLPGRAPGR